MKTVRFEKIVEECGKPDVYLPLLAPAKDRILKAAEKSGRIMTVLQENVGTKADRGEVGMQPGGERQFLLFPKSLKRYAGRVVIGIKYDLLANRDVPKSERAEKRKPPRQKRPSRPAK
jgi:hypothetical protein